MNSAVTAPPVESVPQDPLALLDAPEPAAAAPILTPPRKRRRWLVLGAVALLGAGGATAALVRDGGSAAPALETTKVDRGRITVQVSASGTVSALKTVQVGSQVSGRVAQLFVDFNDQVKQGQLLAQLDTQVFKSEVGQAQASASVARANVTKAEAQLADAQRTLKRSQALGAGQFLAQEQLDQAAAAADVARAALVGARAQAQQAAAQLQQAQLNLAMTAIHSPIDGVVISRSVDVGQTVAASLQAPTIFTIAEDLRKMQVEAHVGESDVAKLKPGMEVSFTVDAYPNRKFVGKLRQVRNDAATVQNVVTYDAIVDVENPGLELRPGMTANVTFVVADRPDVLRIPNAALRFRPTGAAASGARPSGPRAGNGQRPANGAAGAVRDPNQRVVFQPGQPADKAALHPVRVRVGVTDGSYTELVAGDLQEGATLVTDDGTPATPRANTNQNPGGPGMGVPGLGGPGMGGTGMGRGRRGG